MFNSLPNGVKFLVIIVSYFMIGVITYYLSQMLLYIESIYTRMIILYALGWNLVLVGFIFFQTFKYWRLPWRGWYNAQGFETPFWFDLLLVPQYQFLLVRSPFRYLNRRVYIKGRKRDYIKVYYEETRQSETSHIFSGIVTQLVAFYLWISLGAFEGLFFTGFNVVFNIYPLLVQRRNRFRLKDKFDKYFDFPD